MGHTEFIKLRLESLAKKSVDEYTNELLDVEADITHLLTNPNPSVSLFKSFYDEMLAEKLNKCLHFGAEYSDLTKIFSRSSSTLKEFLHQLDQIIDSMSSKMRSSDDDCGEASQEKMTSLSKDANQFEHEEMKPNPVRGLERDDAPTKLPAEQQLIPEGNSVQHPLITDHQPETLQRLAPFSSALDLEERESVPDPAAAREQGQRNAKGTAQNAPASPSLSQELGWNCAHCTFLNSNQNSRCDACGEFKESQTCRLPSGTTYSILSTPQSQYSLGAVSACTNMSLQALYDCLKNIEGDSIPFGCTSSLLHRILAQGSSYTNKSHQDLEDVMSSRPDLANHLYRFPGMIDLDPRDPYQGLKKGERLMKEVNGSIGCVITCQAQSLCVIHVCSTNQFVMFDSHSRQHNGKSYGACFTFFNSLIDVSSYLKFLFPPIDQPDIAWQSVQEQLQYAHLSVGQADYFCLKENLNRHVRPEVSAALVTPKSSPPTSLPPISVASISPVATFEPSLVALHIQPLLEENQRLRSQVHQLEDRMSALKRDFEEKLDAEKAFNRKTQLAFDLFQDKTFHSLQMQADLIESLRAEVVGSRGECLKLREEMQSSGFGNVPVRYSPPKKTNPPSPPPYFEESKIGHSRGSSDKNEEDSSRRLAEEISNAEALRLATFEDDLAFAKRLQEQQEEEEKNEMQRLRELDNQAAADAAYAEQFTFACCICLEKIDIENKFDLEHLDHCVCRDCATSYIEMNVKDRHIPINCMYTNCHETIPERKCFEVLQEKDQLSYLSLSGRPHGEPNFRQCPIPDCAGFDLLDLDQNTSDCRCVICQHHWCCQCQVDLEKSQHQGISCEKYQEWKKDNDQGDEAMETFLRAGLNDVDGDDRMRRCPNCNTAYMKDKACNHVVCTAGCRVHFCFRCAKFSASSAQEIYNHQGSCPGYST